MSQMPQMMSQQGTSQTPRLGGTPQQGPMSQSTMGGLQPRPQMPGFASMFSQQQQYPSQLPGFASMLSQQQEQAPSPQWMQQAIQRMQMQQAPNSTQVGAEAPRMLAMRYLQQLGG